MTQLIPIILYFINIFASYKYMYTNLGRVTLCVTAMYMGFQYLLYAYVDILAVIILLIFTFFNVIAAFYLSGKSKEIAKSLNFSKEFAKGIKMKDILKPLSFAILYISIYSTILYTTWDTTMKRKDILNSLKKHPNTVKIIDDNNEYIITKGTPFINSYNIDIKDIVNSKS